MTGDYRLVLLDVDGTLVNRDRRVTPRTRAALDRARRAGARVSLATGRAFASATPYASEAGADAPLVVYNGARVQGGAAGEVLQEWLLEPVLARTVLSALEGWDVHVSLFHHEAVYIREWTERARASSEKDGLDFIPIGDLAAQLDRACLKMMIIGEEGPLDRLQVHLHDHFVQGGLAPPAIVRSEPIYVEVWNPAASKGVACRWLARHLGIEMSQVIAFGDSYNDLQMLEAAGLGVAMGNAPPAVKAAAKLVTDSNEEDGVANVLERIF